MFACEQSHLWGAFDDGQMDNDEKVASSKKHIFQFKSRIQKPYPIDDQNGENQSPIYEQNGWKTMPFGATHTYMAHTREYPSPLPPGMHFSEGLTGLSEKQ